MSIESGFRNVWGPNLELVVPCRYRILANYWTTEVILGWFKFDPSNSRTLVQFFDRPEEACRSLHMLQNTHSIEPSICTWYLACCGVQNTKKNDGRCIVHVCTKNGGSIVGRWFNVLKVHYLAGIRYVTCNMYNSGHAHSHAGLDR